MISLNINGANYKVDAQDHELLVWVIHEKIGLKRTRFGCGTEMCGACRLVMDGVIVLSCAITVAEAKGRKILTREGVADEHPLRRGP